MTLDASELAEFTENIMNSGIYHGGLRPDHLVLPLAGYSQFLQDPGYAIDDAPPAPLLSNETDLLTIDEVLGNYDPKNQSITLFQPNIQKAAHVMTCQAAAPVLVHGVGGDDGFSGDRNVASFSAGVRPWRAMENRS